MYNYNKLDTMASNRIIGYIQGIIPFLLSSYRLDSAVSTGGNSNLTWDLTCLNKGLDLTQPAM